MEPTDWSMTMDATTAAFAEAHPLETAVIRIGQRHLHVAVARTPEQWAQGLVDHPDVDAMLFVMPPGFRLPFHMKHVDRDIVVAFYGEGGDMVDYAFLQAHVGIKWPAGPYTYALELAEPIYPDIFEDLSLGLSFE
jgi:uncharacterized membrane protein (UPF0127 family)